MWYWSVQAAHCDCVRRPPASSRGDCRFTQVAGGCMSGQAAPDECQRTPTTQFHSSPPREVNAEGQRCQTTSQLSPSMSGQGSLSLSTKSSFLDSYFVHFFQAPVWISLEMLKLHGRWTKCRYKDMDMATFSRDCQLTLVKKRTLHPRICI